MAKRIEGVRAELRTALNLECGGELWAHVTEQIGMISSATLAVYCHVPLSNGCVTAD